MSFKEYAQYDAMGLAALIRTKEITANEVLQAAIERCDTMNPSINAVTRTMYDQAQAALDQSNPSASFYGVPFLLKDLSIDYAGVPTTQGSYFFKHYIPQRDTGLVTRYKRLGLLIMGKTNTPEFGTNWVTESRLLGACRNPYDLTKTPGGSSGGAAAAVAAGIVPAAHASDGGGSIRVPASCCGLIGLKPSRNSASILSVHHVITRSVRDSALFFRARYFDCLTEPLPSLKIGLVTEAPGGYPVHEACLTAVQKAARWCEAQGHHVELTTLPVNVELMSHATTVIWAAELANQLDEYGQFIHRSYTKQDIEPANWVLAKMGCKLPAKDYARALAVIRAIAQDMEQLLTHYDLILMPTLAMPPVDVGYLTYDESQGSVNDFYKERGYSFSPFTSIFNVSGQPAISLPVHKTAEGLPIGVQFAGPMGGELMLLKMAYAWECR